MTTTLLAIIVVILVALAAVVALNDRPRGPHNQWGESQSELIKANNEISSVSSVLDWYAGREISTELPRFG